jgi:hypothetical protein
MTAYPACPVLGAARYFFAHVSFRDSVRLNTGFPGALSFGSSTKYPTRSN